MTSPHDPSLAPHEVPQDDGHLRYLLTAYLFGDISAAGRVEVAEHLATCAECRAELQALRATQRLVEEALEPVEGDASQYAFEERRRRRVMAAAVAQRDRRWYQSRTLWGLVAVAATMVLMLSLAGLQLSRSRPWQGEVAIRSIQRPAPALSKLSDVVQDSDVTTFGATTSPQDTPVVSLSVNNGRTDPNANGLTDLAEADAFGFAARAGVHVHDATPLPGLGTGGVNGPLAQVSAPSPVAPPVAAPPTRRSELGQGRTVAIGDTAVDSYRQAIPTAGAAADPAIRRTVDVVTTDIPRGTDLNNLSGVDPENVRLSVAFRANAPAASDRRSGATAVPEREERRGERRFETKALREELAADDSGAAPASGGEAGPGTASAPSGDHFWSDGRPGIGVSNDALPGHYDEDVSAPSARSLGGAIPAASGKAPAQTAATALGLSVRNREVALAAPKEHEEFSQELPETVTARFDAPSRQPAGERAKYKEEAQQLLSEPSLAQVSLEALRKSELPRSVTEGLERFGETEGEAKRLPSDDRAGQAAQADPGQGLSEGAKPAPPFGVTVSDFQSGGVDLGFAKQGSPAAAGGIAAGANRWAARVDHDEDGIEGLDAEVANGGRTSLSALVPSEPISGPEVVTLGNIDPDGSEDVVIRDDSSTTEGWARPNKPGSSLGRARELQGAAGDLDLAAAPRSAAKVDQQEFENLFGRPARERDTRASGEVPSEGVARGYAFFHAANPTLRWEVFRRRPVPVPAPTIGDEGLGQEGFRARYGVNPFVNTLRDHLSTFAMDVDTASYTLARAALRAGKLPDPKTIRVEEFINAFPELLEVPPDQVFAVACEGGPSPFGAPAGDLGGSQALTRSLTNAIAQVEGQGVASIVDAVEPERTAGHGGLELLKVTIQSRHLRPGERKSAVLTFAVDTSGSMISDDRLGLVRQALGQLVEALAPEDRIAIVGFSSQPYLVLPHTQAREAERILASLEGLRPRGGTNVEAGLDLAYRLADEVLDRRAINRVILCSDGVATSGARGPEKILEKVTVFAQRGIFLSCVGFGMGKYNDALLETLANRGNGNYAYVDSPAAAGEIFHKSLPSTLQVLAIDAKIQVDMNPEVVSHYRLLGYENRDIADKDFRNDKVDAGEVGPGSTVTALYEIQRQPSSVGALGTVRLRYRDAGTGRVEETAYPISPGVLAPTFSATSDRFRFIACAAEMAELLRNSYWARDGSFEKVQEALSGLSASYSSRPEVAELRELALRAQQITVPTILSR